MTALPQVRVYRLYRFYDATGVLLYVGQTGRLPLKRLLEHVDDKPWAHEMACWEVDRRTWSSEADVLAAEKQAIRDECPRYNIAHNGTNPWRVEPPKVSPRTPRRPAVGRRGMSWAWLWSRPTGHVALWMVLAVGVWWAAVHWAAVAVADGAKVGAIGASVLYVFALGSRPKRRRRRKR